MKKGIILLVLIFTACVNLEDTGSNSGGEVKEIKRTDINVSKNYEKRNGILYIDNILFIFPPISFYKFLLLNLLFQHK